MRAKKRSHGQIPGKKYFATINHTLIYRHCHPLAIIHTTTVTLHRRTASFLGCAFLFWFLQFCPPPRSEEFLHSVPFRSFLAGFLFDVPAIPKVRSRNGVPFSFRSFLFLPSFSQGEWWCVFRQESVICPCGIPSHTFLFYVGFNTMLIHSF